MRKPDLFEYALMVSLFFVPLTWWETDLAGLKLSVVDFITLGLVISFAIRVKRRKIGLKPIWTDLVFWLLVGWTALSLPRAINPGKSLGEVIWLAEAATIYFIVSHSKLEKEGLIRVLKAGCYGAVVAATLSFIQYVSSYQEGLGFIRVCAPMNAPNSLAGYLIAYIPLLVAFKYGKSADQRVFWSILAILVGTSLVLTLTRGGWYGEIAALLVLARVQKDKKFPWYLAIYIVICMLTVPQASERAISGLNPGTDTTSVYRMQLWQVAGKMWQEHPLTGAGVGNYILLHDSYLERFPELDHGGKAFEPHNSFLKFLAENGIVGCIIFIWLVILQFKSVIMVANQDKGTASYPLYVGIVCSLLAFVIQSNTNSLFHIPRVAFGVWITLGTISGRMLAVSSKDLIMIPPVLTRGEMEAG